MLILSERLVELASAVDRIRAARERKQQIVNRRRRVVNVGTVPPVHSVQLHTDDDHVDEGDIKQSDSKKMEVMQENSLIHNDLIQVRPHVGLEKTSEWTPPFPSCHGPHLFACLVNSACASRACVST